MKPPDPVAEIEASNARRGAALFDELYPGWAVYVDLPTLTMSSSDQCVLAQVVRNDPRARAERLDNLDDCGSDYSRGVRLLCPEIAMRSGWTLEYGFRAQEFYPALEHAWRQLIEERREHHATPPGSAPPVRAATAEEDLADDMMDHPMYGGDQ